LKEVLRHAAQRGHRRPDRQRERDQAHAVGARPVGVARDRQPEQGVEHREGDAGHYADLRVRQVELAADRLRQDVDDLAVEEIQDVDREQDPQHAVQRLRRQGPVALRVLHPGLPRGRIDPPPGRPVIARCEVRYSPAGQRRPLQALVRKVSASSFQPPSNRRHFAA
jgi:hypothetical protein